MCFVANIIPHGVLNPREEASCVLGWISVACWIIVYSPQFFENYRLKSGEGVSVSFVVIWLLGDILNLSGALMAGLLPTVIILALYYTICDVTLLLQIYYYRFTNPALRHTIWGAKPRTGEQAPLLGQQPATSTTSSAAGKQTEESPRTSYFLYFLAFLFIGGTGLAAFLYNRFCGEVGGDTPTDVWDWKSQVIGWGSAALYLGARIPQIAKNLETKCEGLSIALFVFAISGNLTYALSICVASMEWNHLIVNASWLAGSTLTVLTDLFVVYQFFRFRAERIPKASRSNHA
jgi:uncharacterized protein with PQ loop repeat